MNQIITAFICKIPILSALIPFVLSFPEEYVHSFKHRLHLHSLEYLLKIHPYKDGQTGLNTAGIRFAAKQISSCSTAELFVSPACPSLMPSIASTKFNNFPRQFHRPASTKTGILYANISSKEEKDEILEELKFSAQGILTDSENTKTSQKDHPIESNTDSAKNELANSRKEENSQINHSASSKTEITAPANKDHSDQKEKNQQTPLKTLPHSLLNPKKIQPMLMMNIQKTRE